MKWLKLQSITSAIISFGLRGFVLVFGFAEMWLDLISKPKSINLSQCIERH